MIRIAEVRLYNGEMAAFTEPDWCEGSHEAGLHREDLAHNGPEVGLEVPTRLGVREILAAGLTQNPFASRLEDRIPRVAVWLDGGYASFDPAGLRELADGLVGHAGRLRGLADQLERIRAEAGR